MNEDYQLKNPKDINKNYQVSSCCNLLSSFKIKNANLNFFKNFFRKNLSDKCPDCNVQIMFHPSPDPYCKLTFQDILNDKENELTSNDLCITCLQKNVVCFLYNHPSKPRDKWSLEDIFNSFNFKYKDFVLDRMRRNFTSFVAIILQEKNEKFAIETYRYAELLPGTSTCNTIKDINGYFIDDSSEYNGLIMNCYKNSYAYTLKILKPWEYNRFVDLKNSIPFNTIKENLSFFHQHIVPFHLITVEHKMDFNQYLIMPRYSATLTGQLKSINIPIVLERFWNQISSALKFLHSYGFAYMDIKPSNICTTENGNYILIDIGSVSRFNNTTSSNPYYLPEEISAIVSLIGQIKSSPNIDWWMMAMLLMEILSQEKFIQKKFRTKSEVINILKQNEYSKIFSELFDLLK